MTVLLQGVVGSTAYGLAGPDSDIDRLGMFAAPTTAFHGLHPPLDQAATRVTSKPDKTLHEARKYALLALQGNPTVMELLWLPDYEVCHELGDELRRIRWAFLSAKRVRDAYLGYATQQFHRLETRGDGSFSADTRKRTAKHARHLMRLCWQGLGAYRTGQIRIRVDSPERYHAFGEQVTGGDVQAARDLLLHYQAEFDRARSALPDRPDEVVVERWLRRVRRFFWTDGEEVGGGLR